MKQIQQKNTFKFLLAALAIIMLILPPMAMANSVLTGIFNNSGWYRPIQNYVVPWEARLVAAAIMPMGISSRVTDDPKAAFYMIKNGAAMPVDLAWNCLGWQSVLLLSLSLLIGLRGNYTPMSRVKCVIFGLTGTLLVNVFRMAFIATGIYYVNSLFGMIVHDYFAAFMTILWLMGFWWISYSYLLEEKKRGRQMLFYELSFSNNSILRNIIYLFFQDRLLRRALHGVSRKRGLVLRKRVAGLLLFFLLLAISSGVWLGSKQNKAADMVLASTLVKDKEGGKAASTVYASTSATKVVKQEAVVIAKEVISPTVIIAPFSLTSTMEEVFKESGNVSDTEVSNASTFQIPEYLRQFSPVGTISIQRGKMKARFTADWTNIDTPIIWANFSGSSKANLFEIAGNGQMLFFNNYNEMGEIADSLQVELVNDYKGHEFTIEVRWDFASNPGVKEMTIDGVAAGHEETNFTPSGNAQSQVYTWLIDELVFSDMQ